MNINFVYKENLIISKLQNGASWSEPHTSQFNKEFICVMNVSAVQRSVNVLALNILQFSPLCMLFALRSSLG